VASGFIPTTTRWIRIYEYGGRGGAEFDAKVEIALGKIPTNETPAVPYTMLPQQSPIVQVKRKNHPDALAKFVPPQGYGLLYVTLHEAIPAPPRVKRFVEVRIDDERIGELTQYMSDRFLAMIRHLRDRGLVTACLGDITGSADGVEVRIDGIRACEATTELLDGPPVTFPRLIPEAAGSGSSRRATRLPLGVHVVAHRVPDPVEDG
jgi:hypothetical protein